MAIVTSPTTSAFLRSSSNFSTLWQHHVHVDATSVHQLLARRRLRQPRMLRPETEPYLLKLVALLHSPFDTTLFIDCDLLVLSPSFVVDVLVRSLRVSDLAFPVDPARPGTAILQSVVEPHVLNPSMYGHGIPPLCTAFLGYRRSIPSVTRLIKRAAASLLSRACLTDPTRPSRIDGIRQTDQEALWLELAHGDADPTLRTLFLPEEYYCPGVSWSNNKLYPAVWANSWTHAMAPTLFSYPCHAMHFHLQRDTTTKEGQEWLKRRSTMGLDVPVLNPGDRVA